MGRLSYSRAQIDGFMLAVMSRRVPLSSGEGGAERRVRVCRMLALIRPFGPPSPKGKRTRRFFANLDNLGIDRPYSTKHVERTAEILVRCRFVDHVCEGPVSSRRRAG